MGYDHQNFSQRLKKGKRAEQDCVDYLNENCGFKLEPTTRKEDISGVDFIEGEIKYQVKVRTGKYIDIILDIWEPFYGSNHPKTKRGRDYRGKFDGYILQANNTIYVIRDTKQLKVIIKDIEEEWAAQNYEFDGKGWFYSKIYPKMCSLKYHIDKANGIPKILCFVSPEILYKDKYEIS